jgi:hypothetical protein
MEQTQDSHVRRVVLGRRCLDFRMQEQWGRRELYDRCDLYMYVLLL